MAAACTAQITIGDHPYGWGAPNRGMGPIHTMYLVEGARAAWVLEQVRHQHPETEPAEPISWVASRPERILADALVMISLHIEADEGVEKLAADVLTASRVDDLLEPDYVDLSDFEEEALEAIRVAAQRAVRSKLVVTTMERSSIAAQLALLERCSMYAEVCMPTWVRYEDADGKPRTTGELPPEHPDHHAFTEIRM